MLRKRKSKIFFKFLSILFIILFITSCGDNTQKHHKVLKPKKITKRKIKEKVRKTEKKIKEIKKLHKFIYSVKTDRDPFKPFFIRPKVEESIEDNIPETPLTIYSLAQYKLRAIIKAPGKKPIAMVETAEKFGLFFTVGDYIGKEHFKVVAIEDNVVRLEKKKIGLLNEIKIISKELTMENGGE